MGNHNQLNKRATHNRLVNERDLVARILDLPSGTGTTPPAAATPPPAATTASTTTNPGQS